DPDVSDPMGRYQRRRVVSRGARGEVAGRGGRPPAKMPVGRLAVQAADIEHVDHALGGEIHGALTQRPRRSIAYDRIGRSGAEGVTRHCVAANELADCAPAFPPYELGQGVDIVSSRSAD